jgi:hypothetical protein
MRKPTQWFAFIFQPDLAGAWNEAAQYLSMRGLVPSEKREGVAVPSRGQFAKVLNNCVIDSGFRRRRRRLAFVAWSVNKEFLRLTC